MFIRSVPSVFGNQQSNYLVVIKQMLHQSLEVPDPNVSYINYIIVMKLLFNYYVKGSNASS